jgi:hypothetical protein
MKSCENFKSRQVFGTDSHVLWSFTVFRKFQGFLGLLVERVDPKKTTTPQIEARKHSKAPKSSKVLSASNRHKVWHVVPLSTLKFGEVPQKTIWDLLWIL